MAGQQDVSLGACCVPPRLLYVLICFFLAVSKSCWRVLLQSFTAPFFLVSVTLPVFFLRIV